MDFKLTTYSSRYNHLNKSFNNAELDFMHRKTRKSQAERIQIEEYNPLHQLYTPSAMGSSPRDINALIDDDSVTLL